MDAYAYAYQRFQVADWRPFVEQAIGSVNVVMVALAVMLTVVHVVMDSIVVIDSAAEIEQIASAAVALKSIAVLVVPSHLVDCVAFDSCLLNKTTHRLVMAREVEIILFFNAIRIESYRIAVDHYRCCRFPAGMAFAFVANAVNMVADNCPVVAFAFAVVADDASSFDFSAIADEIRKKCVS